MSAVHIFGIRHHGPGSARRLVEALDSLRPAAVLIEGPADCSDILPMLAHAEMKAPVALLAYAADEPERAVFWPFAEFSPELQAVRWAVANGAPCRLIDLPASWRLAPPMPAEPPADDVNEREANEEDGSAEDLSDPLSLCLERDPIGVLAEAAGYADGESWWRDVIEENPAPGPVFEAVADAMAALREHAPPLSAHEAAREAHMRLEIAKATREIDGPIAIVCGAWHAPALAQKASQSADRALLKGAPKQKIAATWAPWTSPRLAFESGYGAGVAAPGWCAHLWACPPEAIAPRWLARIAVALRTEGHIVSTASVIEAHRLASALAAMRDRPAPGYEELTTAAIACLCFGEPALWAIVSRSLLLGADVGAIPDDMPLAPLLEDLQREQKRLKLKPEALDRELSLDLRTESGLDRSTLLHRLSILRAPWGKLTDAGSNRGTFRERWMLRWEPELAVQLVENLVHGATIAQAASGRMCADLSTATTLADLADLVSASLTAQLPEAVATGIAQLEARAAHTSDCAELLTALPPLANSLRYGQARATDTAQLGALMTRTFVQAAIALPYAARNLDADAARTLRSAVCSADSAAALVEIGGDEQATWRNALRATIEDQGAAPLLSGAAARLLYEKGEIAPADAATLLGRMLSPGRAVADAAGFFEGFFEGAGERLIHDADLRAAVDGWIQSLEVEPFTEHLPLFRRAFANLDRMQRKRLLDALFGRRSGGLSGRVPAPDAEAIWPAHLARLNEILNAHALNEAAADG